MVHTVPPEAPPVSHLLAKPTEATCNPDRAYCFFLSKEMLYPGSRFRMADDMRQTYFRQPIESHRTPQVVIDWQGGEPTLMGVDLFRRSIELVEKYRRPGMTQVNTIQTNGTLLNDEWGETTLDGEPGLNNLCGGSKQLFHHIDEPMRSIANELRLNRAPANVMASMRRKDAEQQKFRPHRSQRFLPLRQWAEV